jgi:hypothetical protein
MFGGQLYAIDHCFADPRHLLPCLNKIQGAVHIDAFEVISEAIETNKNVGWEERFLGVLPAVAQSSERFSERKK